MDATERRLKLDELATWQKNLAFLEAQAAKHGMTTPIDIVNEIDAADRNIRRVQNELDSGQLESTEVSLISILELVTRVSKRVEANTDSIYALERRIFRSSNKTAVAFTRIAYLLLGAIYTSFMIKEIRDAIFGLPAYSFPIVILVAILAALLFYMSTLFVHNRNDDR